METTEDFGIGSTDIGHECSGAGFIAHPDCPEGMGIGIQTNVLADVPEVLGSLSVV